MKPYEVIEPPPDEKPKRKPRRKPRLPYIPWRWVAVAFALGAGITVLVASRVISTVPTVVVVTPPPPTVVPVGLPPTPLPTRTAREFIRLMSQSNGVIAAAGTESLRVYHSLYAAPMFLSRNQYVTALAVSPDGKQTATLSSGDDLTRKDLTLWNTELGQAVHNVVAHVGALTPSMFGSTSDAVAYTPDGRLLATGSSSGNIVFWDSATANLVATLDTGASATLALAFSPNGNQLSAVLRYVKGDAFDHDELRTWDVSAPEKPVLKSQKTLGLEAVSSAVFGDGGRYVAFIAEAGAFIDVWDVEAGRELGRLPTDEGGSAQVVTFNAAGDTLAVAYHALGAATPTTGASAWESYELRIVRWNASGGKFTAQTVSSRRDTLSLDGVGHFHFLDDGSTLEYLALGSNDLWRWNWKTGAGERIDFW
jgi:WD40 repeat protein